MKATELRGVLRGRRVLVCVCGGIAAYKLAETVSLLVQAGAETRVAMTPEATRFVSPLTFEALSGNPVAHDLLGPQATALRGGEAHVALGDWAEVILCAPATANVLAKLAAGLADEVVTTTILASRAQLVVAPAMHERMWDSPSTRDNVAKLVERGVRVAGPEDGRLASGEVGVGRLAGQRVILRAVRDALPRSLDMHGLGVLVSAGGTREALDPVRFLGNRSSGRMGDAIAAAAEARGARVCLVTSSQLPVAPGVEMLPVESASQMQEALAARLPDADILVMAAAVADFSAAHPSPAKVAKADMPPSLDLVRTTDILVALRDVKARPGLVRVGFAAETDDLLAKAERKLKAKGLDLVVANDVSDPSIGMGSPDNAVTIVGTEGVVAEVATAPKEDVADAVLDAALAVRAAAADLGRRTS